jgi:tRNA pseudouridine55 synthase
MSTKISLRNALNGVFPVYKPKGWTSRKATDFVQFALSKELYQQQTGHNFEKKSLRQKDRLKIGHGGTLVKPQKSI